MANDNHPHTHSDRHLRWRLGLRPRDRRLSVDRIPSDEGIAAMRTINQQASAVAMAAFSGAIIGIGLYIAVEYAFLWGAAQ
jgi:hypothetical protein